MDGIRKSLQKHIGTDRNKLLQAEADIKAGMDNYNVSFQISVIALVASMISLFMASIPNDLFFWSLKYNFAVSAGVFAIYGLFKIIRSMQAMKAYRAVQAALEEYKLQLELK